MNKKYTYLLWIGIIIVVLLLLTKGQLFSILTGKTITRGFSVSNPYVNEIVTVNMDTNDESTWRMIDEIIPSGITVTSAQQPIQGHLRHQGTGDWSYTVKATSAGTYTFGGIYRFYGDAAESTIEGDTSITFTTCIQSTEVCDNIDNDCDHEIDEGNLCGAFNSCQNGQCVCISTPADNPNTNPTANCDGCIDNNEFYEYAVKWINLDVSNNDFFIAATKWIELTGCT